MTMTLPNLLLFALSCETALQPAKDDSAGEDLDSTDSTSTVDSGETHDTACTPSSEIPYDGIDQDCNGADLTDVDADGHDAIVVGGDDCLDTDASVYPGAPETPYDSVDQDCSGADLTDVDGDGHNASDVGGDDCLDTDASVHAGATEAPYDGVDQDCSGSDLRDVDGDGQDATEVGGDDCQDSDASIYWGALDVPYDGIDQDCSGTDLLDADGDGHDAAEAGGDDCLDSDATIHPGAAEVPYDGIDQDCSGADLVDIDGDGYVGLAAEGDDCDDVDPTVQPGAPEDQVDSVDNDCDGRVDEYLTCWDGSGDFTTVQEGVDGTPDGGTLEICSGTYVETVTITDREIDIEGDDPFGVVISWDFDGDYSNLITIQGESDVAIRRLGLESDYWCLVYYPETVPVEVDTVDFKQCPGAFRSYPEYAGITIERSYFEGSVAGDNVLEGHSIFRRNVLVADSFKLNVDGQSNLISNNIFTGGYLLVVINPSSADTHMVRATLTNNTFSGLDDLYFTEVIYDGESPATVSLENNIFHDHDRDADGDEDPFFLINWDTERRRYSIAPTCSTNIFPDNPNDLSSVSTLSGGTWVANSSLTTSVDAALLTSGWRVDPLFEDGAMGGFSLSAASPATNSGTGDPDPDGSPPDLGASGGPDGNWWMEVPWPLP